MGSVRAPAKLNLRLAVLAREESGYHQIETLFARLELADEIRITEGSQGIRLNVVDAELGPAQENLVMRAARAFFQRVARRPGIDIELIKRIPAGSGLGGGSSDAAATLVELDRMYGTDLERTALHEMALALGSDVPFFLDEAPFALAWGRGERTLPLVPPPDAHVLIAIADAPMSTRAAYATLDAKRGGLPVSRTCLPRAGALSDWQEIARIAENDFEEVLSEELPGAVVLRDAFMRHGAIMARLTGTGAAVYGVFDNPADLEAASAATNRRVPHARLIRTRTAFGSPPAAP